MTDQTKTQVRVIEVGITAHARDRLTSGLFGTVHPMPVAGYTHIGSLIIGERGYSRTQMLEMVEEIVAKQAEYEEPDWIKAIADKHLGTDLLAT